MKHASFFADFPKETAPADERRRKASSESNPHVRRFETENRNWLVHYSDAYKGSEDADNDKIGTTSANLEVKRERDQPIIHFPHFREWRRGHFFSLRKWEGLVESVSETGFTARLRDVAREVPDERVEIDFDELTNADEKILVKTGVVFSRTMGYSVSRGGTRKRQAVLIFRRMPMWPEDDIKRGCRIADEIYASDQQNKETNVS